MVSPWVLRVAMPSVAMAGTAAYIGYKVWEHVQQQQRVRVSTNSDEEDAELQEALQLSLLLSQQQENESTDDAKDSDWRRALCQSLELPQDTALNDIGSESMLQACLECLAELPVAVRMAFVQWVVTNQSRCSRSTEQQQQLERLEQQLLLLHSLIVSLPVRRSCSEEGEENYHSNKEMTHEDDDNSRQVLVLLLTQVPSLQQDVFLQALEVCPDRPRWLNLLYHLWLHQDTHQPQQDEQEDTDTESPFQDGHDAATERQGHTWEEDTQEDDCPTTTVATTNPGWTLLLEQLQRRYTTQGTAALYQLVQAILALVPQEPSNPNQEEFLVVIPTLFHVLQRLEPQSPQMDHFDDNEDADSVLSSWSRPGHDAVGGCVRGVGLCSGAPDQATRLVWKLHSLSTDRLRSVALSFAVFDNDQISELIDTLLQSRPPNDNTNNNNTSGQSGIWL